MKIQIPSAMKFGVLSFNVLGGVSLFGPIWFLAFESFTLVILFKLTAYN